MNRYLKGVAALSVGLALVGCESKSTVKKETKTTGPGGSTTVIDEKTIKQSGENPPTPNATQPVAPIDGK